jgi:hypothetical protein
MTGTRLAAPARMKRDQKHPPQEPETEKLPVEPEMQKGLDPRESGRTPESEPAKEKRRDDL